MNALSEETKQRIRDEFPKYANKRAVTLPALHIVQDEHRCVSSQAVREVAALLELPPAEVYDTLSFYGFFRDESAPLGKHRVWVCRSLSCALRGGEELLAEISSNLGAEPGETTTDGKITLEFAECLGACEGAPCLLVDDECHMNMTAASAGDLIHNLQ
ncbi:MAG TPA: NAD(P)H-dependent oxidoreductase subunit E [Planctomycetaceae bacterium]|jgi:NADH-quinone oxidoreductase subunit E|nr:NAD(P)H-dependent oxidoreductase subunit E [Planctomycetaceae bacterium]